MSKHKDNQDKGLPSWFPAPNVTLPIGYGTDFSSATYKAFTMDDSLIQTLQTGQRLYLKGVGDDDIVLCTGDKTYALKMVENSNTSLLCHFPISSSSSSSSSLSPSSSSAATILSTVSSGPPLSDPTNIVSIHGSIGGAHELLLIPPRLHRLRELLEMEIYNGPQEENDEVEIIHQEYEEEYNELVRTGKITLITNKQIHYKKRKINEETNSSSSSIPSSFLIPPPNHHHNISPQNNTETQMFEHDAVKDERPPSKNDDKDQPQQPKDEIGEGKDSDDGPMVPYKWNYRRNMYDKGTDGLIVPRTDRGYTFTELLTLVQASKQEIEDGLRFIQAVEFPLRTGSPRWRILNEDYIDTVLDSILVSLMAEGLDTENIPLTIIVHNVTESTNHLACVVEAVVRMFAKSPSSSSSSAHVPMDSSVSLDVQKVSVRRGIRLLKQCSTYNNNNSSLPKSIIGRSLSSSSTSSSTSNPNSTTNMNRNNSNVSTSSSASPNISSSSSSSSIIPFPLPSPETSIQINEFLTLWKKEMTLSWPSSSSILLPELSLDLLRGYILKDTLPNGLPVIYYFPHTKLHHEPSVRFQQLFSVRTTWYGDDLKPFLESLVTPTNKLDDMILKNARMSVGMDKIRSYTSRLHGTAAL